MKLDTSCVHIRYDLTNYPIIPPLLALQVQVMCMIWQGAQEP